MISDHMTGLEEFEAGLWKIADDLRASPQFLNDYELNQTNFALHSRDNARVDASLLELNQVLMDVLGPTRESAAP